MLLQGVEVAARLQKERGDAVGNGAKGDAIQMGKGAAGSVGVASGSVPPSGHSLSCSVECKLDVLPGEACCFEMDMCTSCCLRTHNGDFFPRCDEAVPPVDS